MNVRIASPDAIMYQPQPVMYPIPDASGFPGPFPDQPMYQPPMGYPQ
jgi:hypothetical protein